MGDMTRLLLLLWAGVTVSTAMDLYKRIVGGQPCGNNERHYHVKFNYPGGDICGGSLISDRWVLTAAHCYDPKMTVQVGLHPRPEEEIQGMSVEDHKIFSAKHDIMLVKLNKPVKPEDIKPATLPLPKECKNRPKKGDTVQIAGYAATAEDNPALSTTLQCANTNVIPCPPEWAIPDKESCFDRNMAYPMGGDSGGGVVFNNRIYGVIATELSFVDVCKFLKQINNTMKKRKKCTKFPGKLFNCFQ